MMHLSHRPHHRESLPIELGMGRSGERVVNVVGLVGLALIGVLLLGCLPMISDLVRYLKIKNM